MTNITPEITARIALLARLELTEQELATFTGQLGDLLAYFEKLQELDTTAVEATAHALAVDCPRRPDEPRPEAALGRDELLAQAPATARDGHFVVPKVIE